MGNEKGFSTLKLLFVHVVLFSTLSTHALNYDHSPDPYFQIDKVSITKINEIGHPLETFNEFPSFEEIEDQIKGIVSIGKLVWSIIEEGKPSHELDPLSPTGPISIVPVVEAEDGTTKNADPFYEMSNWSAPQAITYNIAYKNKLGINVITFDYVVHFQPGGKYLGSGNYLTGVDVTARNINVIWGYKLNAAGSIRAVSNMGSLKDPIASTMIKVTHKISTPFNDIEASQMFHISGDGKTASLY